MLIVSILIRITDHKIQAYHVLFYCFHQNKYTFMNRIEYYNRNERKNIHLLLYTFICIIYLLILYIRIKDFRLSSSLDYRYKINKL